MTGRPSSSRGDSMRAVMKAKWQEPEYRKTMLTRIHQRVVTPEQRTEASQLMKARWQDPVYREKMIEANQRHGRMMRGRRDSPETRAKKSAAHKARERSEEVTAASRENIKRARLVRKVRLSEVGERYRQQMRRDDWQEWAREVVDIAYSRGIQSFDVLQLQLEELAKEAANCL